MNLAVNNEKGTFSLTLRLKYDEIPGRGPWNCCWSQTRLTGLSYKAQPVFSSNKKYSVPDLTGPRGQKVDDNNQKVRQSALPADMSSWISLNTANLGVGSRRVMGLNVWQLLERNYKTQRPNIEECYLKFIGTLNHPGEELRLLYSAACFFTNVNTIRILQLEIYIVAEPAHLVIHFQHCFFHHSMNTPQDLNKCIDMISVDRFLFLWEKHFYTNSIS